MLFRCTVKTYFVICPRNTALVSMSVTEIMNVISQKFFTNNNNSFTLKKCNNIVRKGNRTTAEKTKV